ncbi:MAG: Ig-like domain-containing protein, partial [Gemmatimonadaceae bacterium]
MSKLSWTSRALVASAMLASVACSNGEGAGLEPKLPGQAGVPYALSLPSQQDTLVIGFSRILTALVVDGAGATQNVEVEWRSLQPSIVSVSDGNITAITAGSAMIVARYGAAIDTATIVVSTEKVHLQVWPSALSASLGDTVTFTAQLVTARGVALGVPQVTWAASDSQSLTLVGDGHAEMREVGNVDVIARLGTMTATASVSVLIATVSSVTVTPSSAVINVGLTVDLNARVLDNYGRPVVLKKVVWSSSNPAVATVTNSGIVRGVSPGGVIITATSGGKSGTATITVSQPSSSVTLDLAPVTITVGFPLQAVATPRDASGTPVTGRTIVYQSSNPAVASVSTSGAIVGIVAGVTDISATCDGHMATVQLTVQNQIVGSVAILPFAPTLQQGSSAALVADVKDQLGQAMPGAVVTWTAQSPAIATVSPSGVVTGVQFGTATVTAESGGLATPGQVTVTSIAVASVQVSPSTVFLNQTTQLSATAFNAAGQPIVGAIFAWSVTGPAIASVSALGVVSGIAIGTTTVTATSDGQSGSATITVSDAPPAVVDSVNLTVNSLILLPGEVTQAVATTFDSTGSLLTGRLISWSSLNPTLATVSASGLITALAAGSVTISATAEGVSGFATIIVSPPPVAFVTATLPATPLLPGLNAQLTVILTDAQSIVLTGRSIAYSSSNTAVATVSASGLVHAVAAGTASVTVLSEGVSATVAITVQPAPLLTAYTVTVTLNASAIQVGQTSQGTAVVKDSLGNTLSGQTLTWSSANASVATVSSSGLVTAVGAGAATISASTSGKTGTATLNVTPLPPVLVTVSMGATSLIVGQSLQASAVAKDAQNQVVPGVTFVWSVSSSSVLSVSATGMVSAVAVGSAQLKAVTAGVTGSFTLTVTVSPTQLVAPAELPRVYLNFPYKPPTGNTITVLAGGSLQNALNAAQRGDEIVLQAGATFTG